MQNTLYEFSLKVLIQMEISQSPINFPNSWNQFNSNESLTSLLDLFLSLPVDFYYIFVEKNTSVFKLTMLYYSNLKVA